MVASSDYTFEILNQPEARLAVGEDPHHPRAPLYLLVETFEAVGGADAPDDWPSRGS